MFVAGEENLTGLYVDSIKAINRSGSKEQRKLSGANL